MFLFFDFHKDFKISFVDWCWHAERTVKSEPKTGCVCVEHLHSCVKHPAKVSANLSHYGIFLNRDGLLDQNAALQASLKVNKIKTNNKQDTTHVNIYYITELFITGSKFQQGKYCLPVGYIYPNLVNNQPKRNFLSENREQLIC